MGTAHSPVRNPPPPRHLATVHPSAALAATRLRRLLSVYEHQPSRSPSRGWPEGGHVGSWQGGPEAERQPGGPLHSSSCCARDSGLVSLRKRRRSDGVGCQ